MRRLIQASILPTSIALAVAACALWPMVTLSPAGYRLRPAEGHMRICADCQRDMGRPLPVRCEVMARLNREWKFLPDVSWSRRRIGSDPSLRHPRQVQHGP